MFVNLRVIVCCVLFIRAAMFVTSSSSAFGSLWCICREAFLCRVYVESRVPHFLEVVHELSIEHSSSPF